jgi:ABC-type Mn2+/Zn2+ transport system permease subunit
LAVIETWGGIALAYLTDWPTTFWIVLLSCLVYGASLATSLTLRRASVVEAKPPQTGCSIRL